MVMTGVVVSGGSLAIIADTIGDSTTVQIGLVGGLCLGVFYAGATLQKLKDGQSATNRRLDRIERRLDIAGKDREEK